MRLAGLKLSNWFRVPFGIFNFVVFPFIIFLLAFNVNSFHGVIDALESGQYLSCINAIFHGKVPYRDFIPPVGPLFIWILSAVLFLLGKTIYALRLYFLVATIVVYIILYFFGQSLYRWRISAYILPIIALVETFNPFWASRWAGYSRMGAGLFGLFLQVLYIKKKKPLYLFFSGAAAGFALLYGIDSGISLIVCGILACFLITLYEPNGHLKGDVIKICRRGIIFCLGLVSVLAPFTIYMALNKAFLPYLEGTYLIMRYHIPAWQTQYPSFIESFKHYNSNLWSFFISDEFRIYMPRLFYFFVIIYIIYAFKNKKAITESMVMLLITVYGILSYKSGCRVVRDTQFDAGLIPLLLLLVYFMEKSFLFLSSNSRNFIKWDRLKTVWFGALVAILGFAFSSAYITASHKRVYYSWSNWLKYQKQKDKIIPVYTFLKRKDDVPLVASSLERIGSILVNEDEARQVEAVTEYIKNNTLRDEPIFTFPEHGLYNFLADRPAVTRFYIAVYAHTANKWKKELLFDLRDNPPRYVIYSHSLSYIAKNIGRKNELLPDAIRFILENYYLEKSFGQIGIYRKNF